MAGNDQPSQWKSLSQRLRDKGQLEGTDEEGKKYRILNEENTANNQAGQHITLALKVPRFGEGGFALVYRGTKIEGGKGETRICLKQAREDRTGRALKNEIKHFGKLGAGKAHENIIQMLFTCKVGEEEFIGLEFFEGKDLHQLVSTEHERNSSVRSLAHQHHISVILCQQAQVIKFLQDKKIIHRDFTPANILYNPSSQISKLIDFGLACSVGDKIDGCTPEYAAPEILLEEPCDQTVDVYGLGATLAHLVTLQTPWHSLSAVYLTMYGRGLMYADSLKKGSSEAAAVERLVNILITEAIRKELKRFKKDDGTSSYMVVQKELGQAAEDFDDKLLKTIKDMMCFDKDERTKIYDLIKETELSQNGSEGGVASAPTAPVRRTTATGTPDTVDDGGSEGGVASAPTAPVRRTTATGPPGTVDDGDMEIEEDIAKHS